MYRFGMKVLLYWIGIIGILAAISQSDAGQNVWTPLNEPFYKDVKDVSIAALAINPQNPNIIYAGTWDGIYRSIDSGNSWKQINNWYVNALAINPNKPNIIYAATDRGEYGGVYKSIDSGDNWNQILKEPTGVLAIDPTNPNTIFAGIYRSRNSGQSWVKINISSSEVRALAINPKEPNIIFAGTHGYVYKSTDSGDSWQGTDTGHYMVSKEGSTLVIDPIHPNIIYAGTKNIIYNGIQEGGVYKSEDSGKNWLQVNNGLTNWYVNALAINPINPNIIYAAVPKDGVFVSRNSGENWEPINDGMTDIDSSPFGVHTLAIDPINPNTIYAGTSEGRVWVYTDVPFVTASTGTTQIPTTPSAEKWAILIGIDKYEDMGVNPLKYTVKDVEELYNVMITTPDGFKPDNVILMTPNASNPVHRPTYSNVLTILNSWFKLATENDTILLYYSGHGTEQDNNSYILPQDAKTSAIKMTSIDIEYLKEMLRSSKAQKRILILDACHSGAGKAAGTMGRGFANSLEDAKGMVTLASCDLNESSYEMDDLKHGAFTYFLIEALKGEADRDKDEELWASEVNYYVWDNTRKWAAKNGLQQTPKYVSAVSGEIVLAKVGKSTTDTESFSSQIGIIQPTEASYQIPLQPLQPSEMLKTIISKDGAEMVLIPAGEFIMGSSEGEGEPDERPQHKVYLDAFYIDKYEVTNAQYKKFMDATGRPHPAPEYWNDDRLNKPNQPVVGIRWEDADAYCKWAGKRLPTEAEWEKAARGTDGRRYPWGNEAPDTGGIWRANYAPGGNRAADGFELPAPVGNLPAGASPYGVMDMAGNVREWVADWYNENYYSISPKNNPKGPDDGVDRILRGGSWAFDNDNGIRSANRTRVSPEDRIKANGFRCAQDVIP